MIPVLNKRVDRIPKGAVYVGRPSVFGNPFPITKLTTREKVVEKYRAYFYERVRSDLVFIASAWRLQDATALVCWCSPEKCHGDVIAEWIEASRCQTCGKIEAHVHEEAR